MSDVPIKESYDAIPAEPQKAAKPKRKPTQKQLQALQRAREAKLMKKAQVEVEEPEVVEPESFAPQQPQTSVASAGSAEQPTVRDYIKSTMQDTMKNKYKKNKSRIKQLESQVHSLHGHIKGMKHASLGYQQPPPQQYVAPAPPQRPTWDFFGQ